METVLLEAEKYVVTFLNENLDKSYVYHNISHTQRVVNKVKELSEASKVSTSDYNQLLIAAWFHDTGFVKNWENQRLNNCKILGRRL